MIVFQHGDEVVVVTALGNNILFSNSQTNFNYAVPIDNVKLNIQGILKQFPDLNGLDDSEIRKRAIERFKDHIKTLNSQMEIKDYLVGEFLKMGYTLQYWQKEGFRPQKK